jgi:threonine synthase
VAVSDEALLEATSRIARTTGLDVCPEGGAAVAALEALARAGAVTPGARAVVFNTGAGWLYR